MNKWRASTWGDEISLEYGKGIRGYADASGPVRVFGTNGPVGWTNQPIADGPGVILGRKGAYRGVRYSAGPFFVIDTAYYAVPKTPLNMRWLYYAMIYHELGTIDDGSPIPSTTRAAVYPRELLVPPIDEQEAIARALGAFDDKIEQNRQTARALEELARATFKAWFVDFEPVKNKAAGLTSFPGLPPTAFATLPDRLTDSILGPVPQGWQVGTLGDLLRERGERITPGEETQQLPYVPIDCITSKQVTLETFKSGEEAMSSLIRFQEGDILFGAMRPYFHKVCLAPFSGTTRTTCFVLTPHTDSDRIFALMLTSEDSTVQFATTHSVGSTIPYAKWQSSLREMPCVLPPVCLRAAFEMIADPLIQLCNQTVRESAKLAVMRDYLLPRLLSGQVRVSPTQAGLKV